MINFYVTLKPKETKNLNHHFLLNNHEKCTESLIDMHWRTNYFFWWRDELNKIKISFYAFYQHLSQFQYIFFAFILASSIILAFSPLSFYILYSFYSWYGINDNWFLSDENRFETKYLHNCIHHPHFPVPSFMKFHHTWIHSFLFYLLKIINRL